MQKHLPSEEKLFNLSPVLLITVVLFGTGICWAETLYISREILLAAIGFLLTVLLIIHLRNLFQSNIVSTILLGILFFILGLQHAKTFWTPLSNPAHISNHISSRQAVSLHGILQKYPVVITASSDQETRIIMKVEVLHQHDAENLQKQKHTRVSGLVQLALKGLMPADLKPGDRFFVKANVSPVSTYSVPGAFNYKKHLAAQAILVKGWIKMPENIIKLNSLGESPQSYILSAIKYFPERIRYDIANFLDDFLDQPARGLYKAVLIGDRTDVPASVIENFIGAGCIHILAISGMHMGLLALVVIFVLTWILKRSTWILLQVPVQKISVAIALLPLLIYALIAGFNIPVLRALLMASVGILAILFDRPGNLINHILLAALIILIWQPAAIFSASFQLSFSAVTAIAIIYPKLLRFLFHNRPTASPVLLTKEFSDKLTSASFIFRISGIFSTWMLAGVTLTTVATLGTLPLLIFHFNRFSLVAPVTNLLVEPLICFWSLLLGLVACLCIPLFPALANTLFVAGSGGLILAEKICVFFSALPYSTLWLPTPSPVEITLIYLILLSFCTILHVQGTLRIYPLIMAILLLCSLVAVSVFTKTAKQSSRLSSVTFLDVGHGASILLQLPGNKNILIDGGGAESERFNVGERLIGPFLWNQKIRHLDAVVVTHPHADHYNGLPFILARFRPKKIWINGTSGHDSRYRELLTIAGQLAIETKIAKVGETIFQAGTTHLLCIHSSDSDFNEENSQHATWVNPNDLSIVLRLETENKSFLLPADISGAVAGMLIKKGTNLKADVLMAPHHGSPSSMNQEFIRAVAPEFIAISAGRNNPFNFPAQSFLDLQQKGIEVLTTSRDGTITFIIENGRIMAHSYQVN